LALRTSGWLTLTSLSVNCGSIRGVSKTFNWTVVSVSPRGFLTLIWTGNSSSGVTSWMINFDVVGVSSIISYFFDGLIGLVPWILGERKKANVKSNRRLIYHSICGLGEPETSTVKTASVCNKASVSVGFLVIFGAAKTRQIKFEIFLEIILRYF